MNYWELVAANKDRIVVEYKRCINDETLLSSYSFSTNLHCDFGICDKQMRSEFLTKKRKFNKLVQQYQKATGKKFKLVRTENDLGYTRLVYSLK